MSPRVIASAEELEQLVGQEIGTSDWVGGCGADENHDLRRHHW